MRISHMHIMVLIKSVHFFLLQVLISVPQNYPESNFMCFFTFNLLSSFWTDNLLAGEWPIYKSLGSFRGQKLEENQVIFSEKLSVSNEVSSQCGTLECPATVLSGLILLRSCVCCHSTVNSYVHLPSCFQKTLSLCSILPWVFIFPSHLFEPWEEGYNIDFPFRAEYFTLS